MSELISAKEALFALENGEEVEFKCGGMSRTNLDAKQQPLEILIDKNVKLRLKPKTITLNGIEVPAPSEPKDYESLWVLDSATPLGYRNIFHHGGCVHFMCWHTENEIKQVVSALRTIFKTN